MYQTGQQTLTTKQAAGSELVGIDNGAAVDTAATTSQVAGAPINFGNSAGQFNASGNLNTQISGTGIQPGGTAGDYVLATFTIPANAFDKVGRAVQIQAEGSFGATSNNKRVKIIMGATTAVVGSTVVGGTTIGDTGTVTTNGGGWAISAEVVKYGATGSNTQLALHQQAQVGNAVSALLAPQPLTLTESSSVIVALTGNAATAASDIIFNFMQALAQN